MKSNKEWFTLLTPEEQEKFKRNCDDARFNRYMNSSSIDLMDFIDGGFNHNNSDEGWEYWGEIATSNRKLNENK